jgi:transmembrane sensor
VLADGSHVTLNTDSVVEVRFSRGHRDVDLQRGEAQFDVAHDATRPFVVHTGMGTVTALGTRFDVRRYAGDEAVVTLLRGSVAVKQGDERRTLHPNEQALLLERGGITVRTIDPAQVNAWVGGWLRFADASLGEVVAEANRYSPRKLRLADPQLASLRLHGSFHVGDTASIAAAAEQLLPVRVQAQGNDIVLSPARKK